MPLRLATFNIRNVNDRYQERAPLLGQAFAAIDADVICLQEVHFSEDVNDAQDLFLASHLPARNYRSLDSRSERSPDFGNAILVSAGEVQAHEELRLSRGRSAHRVLLALPGARVIWVVNTHLHHKPEEPAVRAEQAAAILQWMAEAPGADAAIVAGDFNTPPFEPAYDLMTRARYRSAMLEANGAEPPVTWPSGIQAPTMDTEGDPNCLDYIWLTGDVRVVSATLAADAAHPTDPTLYPSDHFALVAELDWS
ncbi:MAG: endonuclease/exonuclease/phosphatase family protein [Dehalococcoidia bacterium]